VTSPLFTRRSSSAPCDGLHRAAPREVLACHDLDLGEPTLRESPQGQEELAGAQAHYAFRQVGDGDVLDLGNVFARVLHTPGHTPEHISLVVTDATRGPEPWLVFTGHTLMIGDMGRTELASTPDEGARALFDSAQKLHALPDYLTVLPGAVSGSVCGRGLSGNPVSTLGFEKRFNRAFRIAQRDEFVRHMLQETPPPPPRAAEIRAVNLGRHGAAA